MSTGPLVACGKQYELSFNDTNNGRSGHDCEFTGFFYDISRSVQVGDNVSVTFALPPNGC